MFNSVSVIGALLEVDKSEPNIRYLLIERAYSNLKSGILTDKVPIMNWNKEAKGEVFSFPERSLVALRGRIETYNSRVVIVVETITNLKLKY